MSETIEAFLERKEDEIRTGKIFPFPAKSHEWRSGYEAALVDVMAYFDMVEILTPNESCSTEENDDPEGIGDPAEYRVDVTGHTDTHIRTAVYKDQEFVRWE